MSDIEDYAIHPQNEEPNIDPTALGVFKILYDEDCEIDYIEDEDGNTERPSVFQIASLSRRVALVLNGYLRHLSDVYEGPPREFLIHLQYQQNPMKSATWIVEATSTPQAIEMAKAACLIKHKIRGHCLSVDGVEYDDE